jgi:hypothetical protein
MIAGHRIADAMTARFPFCWLHGRSSNRIPRQVSAAGLRAPPTAVAQTHQDAFNADLLTFIEG